MPFYISLNKINTGRESSFGNAFLPKKRFELKSLGGEKEKNEKQYEKYTERDYSDFVCGDDGCECFGGSTSC
jgi:hypothetical protein